MNFTDNIDGYYIPKDNLSNPYYKKCSVENCKKCYGHSYKDICISCLKSFIPIMNENHKIILCQYNSTKEENTIEMITTNIISSCQPGYYLPEGKTIENECKQCSLFGCEICHGNNTINYCDLCFPKYVLKYIDNNLKCIECEKNCLECEQKTFKCLKCDKGYVVKDINKEEVYAT